MKGIIPRYQITLVREGGIALGEYSRFSNSRDIFARFKPELADADRETFAVIVLDSKNKIIGWNVVSVGSLNTSVVHPREVMKAAILLNAAAIVCVHNHPSGDPAPSREDLDCTRRLFHAAKLLGVTFLDHIIFGDADYYSFADAGMLQEMSDADGEKLW